jgi:hypothetical protein
MMHDNLMAFTHYFIRQTSNLQVDVGVQYVFGMTSDDMLL